MILPSPLPLRRLDSAFTKWLSQCPGGLSSGPAPGGWVLSLLNLHKVITLCHRVRQVPAQYPSGEAHPWVQAGGPGAAPVMALRVSGIPDSFNQLLPRSWHELKWKTERSLGKVRESHVFLNCLKKFFWVLKKIFFFYHLIDSVYLEFIYMCVFRSELWGRPWWSS